MPGQGEWMPLAPKGRYPPVGHMAKGYMAGFSMFKVTAMPL